MPWGREGFGTAQRREEFYRLMQITPSVTDLQAIDASGLERLYVSRRADDRTDSRLPFEEPALLQARTGDPPRFGPTFHRDDLSPAMHVGVSDGVGTIVATVDLRLLGDIVSRLRIGQQGVAYVVDAHDVLIAHPRPTEVLRRPDLSRFDAVRRARQAAWPRAAPLEIDDTVDLEGRPVIATAVHIQAPDWLLIVEQPRAEALQPALATLRRTGLLVAFGACLALWAGVLFARRMARPIVTLRRATERIAGGDLAGDIELHTGDEIEDLAHDFNQMAARLRESYEGLEAQVASRTAELLEARDKLQVRAAEVAALNERLVDQLTQLAARKEEAERANASKTRFLATASHDLRQPMHSIGLLVAVLRDRLRDPAQVEIAGKVQASVETMESLFGSLLDISKLDAVAVRPDIAVFELAPLFARLREVWTPLAAERGLRLVVRPTRLAVRSDEGLLERIVGNLVSNAIRYTQKGGVVVAARRRGDEALIQVYDTGPGIDPKHHGAIFEEFFRIDPPGTSPAKGLGLGLSIVQRGTQILGHEVRVESRLGRGSMFEVTLPCAGTRAAPGVAGSPTFFGSEAIGGAFVVVIDDDDGNRQALADLLAGWGCHVLAARSTEDAAQQSSRHLRVPDLIITDWRLQGGDNGVRAIETLRALHEESIAALIVTADSSGEASLRAAGLDARLLHKPAGAVRLLGAVLDALRSEAVP
jgi:signal transduction histidine kinase/CheY-like chemotaxis protein